MSRMTYTAADRERSRARMRDLLPAGSDVYVITRSVSKSGMTRRVSVFAVENGGIRDITIDAGKGAGFTVSDRGPASDWEIVLTGAGMDMHFHFVYSLAKSLHGDGYALNKVSL